MMIFPGAFLKLCEIFIVWAARGLKGQNMAKDDKKNLSVAVYISETIYHMIVIYGTLVKMIISPGAFFIFSKF